MSVKRKEKEGPQSRDRNITPFLKNSNPLELRPFLRFFGACGTAAERVGVPMFEEHFGVGVQEAGEPSNGVGRTVRAVVVVPARHLALVFIASHMRGDTEDGFVDVAVAETTSPVRGAVLDLVPWLQLETFVAECWVSDSGLFVRVMEGDVVFI